MFCSLCTGGSHTKGDGQETLEGEADEHTVIPFSIAIKRMSEILLYKANECTAKLNAASEVVTEEMHRLDHSADTSFASVNALFEEVIAAVQKRRLEVLGEVKAKKEEKRKVLEEQLKIISSEKKEVECEVESLQQQVEVRNITKKISELNSKLDTISHLGEPRENSFMHFRRVEGAHYEQAVARLLGDVGEVKTSRTFPSLCRVAMETAVRDLRTVARVQTIDYHGVAQAQGGDPVTATVTRDGKEVPVEVVDREDGTYEVSFTPQAAGTFCLNVSIFNRPVKDCPLFFEVTEHNSPAVSFGSRGQGDAGFVQPCSLTTDARDHVYVVDTGNSRIKILDGNLNFQSHILNESLEGRSVTGISLGSSGDTLVTVNWRTKTITEMTLDGTTIGGFSHDELVEPIAVAVTPDGDLYVADNGVGAVLVFESCGKLKRKIGAKGKAAGQFREMAAVAVCENGDVAVGDTRVILFSPAGEFLREFGGVREGKESRREGGREGGKEGGKEGEKEGGREGTREAPAKGRYCGLVFDPAGRLLAARAEKGRAYIQVQHSSPSTPFLLPIHLLLHLLLHLLPPPHHLTPSPGTQVWTTEGRLVSTIDSHGARLRRPTGVAVGRAGAAFVVDIGGEAVRKYRYM